MKTVEPPKLTFPPEEAACLKSYYERARIILEYGSGGSTWLGASLPGKYIMSVESDRHWAVSLQHMLDVADLASPAIVWHVDIGPTGDWGRPLDDRAWQRFHLYALSIWDQPFLCHPDLILIDGRFRPACVAAACLRISCPVTVLFDDYVNRPHYHVVERFVRPERILGRMAIFQLAPGSISPDNWTDLIGLFGQTNYASDDASE